MPVYHCGWRTWVEFKNGAYDLDTWECPTCRQTFPVLKVLRAYPGLTADRSLDDY